MAYSSKTDPDREMLDVDAIPGCDPETGRRLWLLEEARSRTRKALEDLSGEQLDWTPAARAYCNSSLLYHIAAIELGWLSVEVRQKPFPDDLAALFRVDVADAEGLLARARGESLVTQRARLDAVRERLLETYRGMTWEDLRRPRSLDDYDVTPEWVLFHLRDHETTHRGELGLTRNLANAAT